jgi:hypothetical protein
MTFGLLTGFDEGVLPLDSLRMHGRWNTAVLHELFLRWRQPSEMFVGAVFETQSAVVRKRYIRPEQAVSFAALCLRSQAAVVVRSPHL